MTRRICPVDGQNSARVDYSFIMSLASLGLVTHSRKDNHRVKPLTFVYGSCPSQYHIFLFRILLFYLAPTLADCQDSPACAGHLLDSSITHLLTQAFTFTLTVSDFTLKRTGSQSITGKFRTPLNPTVWLDLKYHSTLGRYTC